MPYGHIVAVKIEIENRKQDGGGRPGRLGNRYVPHENAAYGRRTNAAGTGFSEM